MPTRDEHIAKEREIAALAAQLEAGTTFSDWLVVATAYRALHLVEAYLAGTDTHSRTHIARNRAVQAMLPSIELPYVALQELSRLVRYEASGLVQQSDYEVALADFAAIEAELRPRL